MDRSPSELGFLRNDGSMMSVETPLENVLRSALGRAGIVTGYRHTCRRQGCGYVAHVADPPRGAAKMQDVTLAAGARPEDPLP